MVSSLLARCIIVTIGTLYPGYRSYKSLINSDLREVVNCLRYWIVFSVFIACETITDIFLSWFPFYYWIKIFLVLWMISPAGSTLLYKRFVQPVLKEREQEIDQLLEQTKQKGYTTLCDLTSKSFRYASNMFLNTAVLGQAYLGEHLKRSLSTSDLDSSPLKSLFSPPDTLLEEDEEIDPKVNKRLKEAQTHPSKSNNNVNRRARLQQRENPDNTIENPLGELKTSEDIIRKKQRAGNKTSSTVYSSNESAHIGTISKRQMAKTTTTTTTKKPVAKPTRAVEQEINASNDIDDENENV
ncbi:unnamed protein product [Rotaria sordida]|uniref:Receptor expression-enhancing protein n=1 Tax=Rotaria sordida TaxID=392033 RepID=A0A815S3H9_9BILA|nr:unnamed protein product [Rotaria sordida]CAF1485240.1 unnamed protein product [Rotaria sordida]